MANFKTTKAKWRDVTSYSQGQVEHKPRSFRMDLSCLTLSVIWSHRDLPDTWSASLFHVFDMVDLGIDKYEDRDKALTKALFITKRCLSDIIFILEHASTTIK